MKIKELLESIQLREAANKEIVSFLQKKYKDIVVKSNNIFILAELPIKGKTQARKNLLATILADVTVTFPNMQPHYSNEKSNLSSIGYIAFGTEDTRIIVKDKNIQGDKSAGVGNELEIANMIKTVITTHGHANVVFVDNRNKQLRIDGVTNVEISGRTPGTRKGGGAVKKADVVLASPTRRLPVSIKEISAESWESADTMFGARARQIIDKLVKEGIVELIEISPSNYKLSKEIVVEPTEEEALRAIFGSDINPDGGIVVQTFKPEHFVQEGPNVMVHAHAVIANKDDIPESHLMVWLLRNNSGRLSKAIGIRGIRPIASVMHRAMGKGNKNIVIVNNNGDVIS